MPTGVWGNKCTIYLTMRWAEINSIEVIIVFKFVIIN